MICENCKCEHPGSYGSGRFCTIKCSRGFSTKANRLEISRKVSLSMKKPEKITSCDCIICAKEFNTVGRVRKICSEQCRNILKKRSAVAGAQTKTLRGTHSGWHTRKGEMSYPEKYFKSVFDSQKLSFVQELKIGKWFIDFAFPDKKIAIEIDGRQHTDPDRKLSDKKKDSHLLNLGWEVIRVQWVNPINEKNKLLLYAQIDRVLNSVKC